MSQEKSCWAMMFNAFPSRDVIGGSGLVVLGGLTLWFNHKLGLESCDLTSLFFIWSGIKVARGEGPHRVPS